MHNSWLNLGIRSVEPVLSLVCILTSLWIYLTCIYTKNYFWVLCSVQSVYLSVFIRVPHHLDYLVIGVEIERLPSSFFKSFAVSSLNSSDFHHILFCFYKDCHDSFDNELIGWLTLCVVIKESFLILHVSFVIFMIFTDETLSCGKEDTFTSFSIWGPLISFSHLIALRISVLCWSVVQSVRPCLLLDLRGKAFIISPLLCSFHNGIYYVDNGIIYCL